MEQRVNSHYVKRNSSLIGVLKTDENSVLLSQPKKITVNDYLKQIKYFDQKFVLYRLAAAALSKLTTTNVGTVVAKIKSLDVNLSIN